MKSLQHPSRTAQAPEVYDCSRRDYQLKPGRKKESQFMIGEQIGETRGKRIVRRVLSTEPPTIEVTFEASGHLFGVATTGMGTYTSVINPDGSIFGQGEG